MDAFLTRAIARVRKVMDDPRDKKYDDDDIIETLKQGYAEALRAINGVSRGKVRVEFDVAIVADVREYMLPPDVGEFLEFYRYDSEGGVLWEPSQSNYLSPHGAGWSVEYPILKLDAAWSSGFNMRIAYVPNGEIALHYGVGSLLPSTEESFVGDLSTTGVSNTVVFANSPCRPWWVGLTVTIVGGANFIPGTYTVSRYLSDSSVLLDAAATTGSGSGGSGNLSVAVTTAGTKFALSRSPTKGERDTRPNAYLGHILRVYNPDNTDPETLDVTNYGLPDGEPVQERIITAYDWRDSVVTLAPGFSPAWSAGFSLNGAAVSGSNHGYEIVPLVWSKVEEAVILYTSRWMAASIGDAEKVSSFNQLYQVALRSQKLISAGIDRRRPTHFSRRQRRLF